MLAINIKTGICVWYKPVPKTAEFQHFLQTPFQTHSLHFSLLITRFREPQKKRLMRWQTHKQTGKKLLLLKSSSQKYAQKLFAADVFSQFVAHTLLVLKHFLRHSIYSFTISRKCICFSQICSWEIQFWGIISSSYLRRFQREALGANLYQSL